MNIVSYAVESRVATVKQHKQGSVHQATMTWDKTSVRVEKLGGIISLRVQNHLLLVTFYCYCYFVHYLSATISGIKTHIACFPTHDHMWPACFLKRQHFKWWAGLQVESWADVPQCWGSSCWMSPWAAAACGAVGRRRGALWEEGEVSRQVVSVRRLLLPACTHQHNKQPVL